MDTNTALHNSDHERLDGLCREITGESAADVLGWLLEVPRAAQECTLLNLELLWRISKGLPLPATTAESEPLEEQ